MRASAVAPERRRPSFMRGYAPLGWSEACPAVPSAGRYGLKLGNGFEG